MDYEVTGRAGFYGSAPTLDEIDMELRSPVCRNGYVLGTERAERNYGGRVT